MDNNLFVTLKYYSYFANGIRLKTKKSVYEAIKLKIANVIRKDKMDKKVSRFDYKTLRFEV